MIKSCKKTVNLWKALFPKMVFMALLAMGLLCLNAAKNAALAENGNSVVAFFQNSELQSETDEQRLVIQQALKDMLDKSPAELSKKRYFDYQGVKRNWSVIDVLQHYFVPNPPRTIDRQEFYKDYSAPEAHAAIQNQLDNLKTEQ